MTQTCDVAVKIADGIKADPTVFAAVQDATTYFVEKYRTLPNNAVWVNAGLSWLPSPGLPGYLRLVFREEHPEYEGHIHLEDIKLDVSSSELKDAYGLTANMHRLLRRVTRARSTISGKRIDQLLVELDQEEGANG